EEIQKAEPHASLAEHKKRLEGLVGKVAKWNDHAAMYEKARASLAGRSLADPAFETVSQDGIADRAAERLSRGRKAMNDGFNALLAKLDVADAETSFQAAKEDLKGVQGAGAWIDGCLLRVRKL